MKVCFAEHGGFCFGVSRAIELVNEAAKGHPRVFTYGKIIHNEQVVDELASRGVRAIGT